VPLALVAVGCGNGDDDDASDASTHVDGSLPDATTGVVDSAPPSSDASADAGGDAAAGDAGADAAPPCTAIFCDDFETGSLDGGKWTTDVGYAAATTVTVTTEKPAHGAYSAHAHVDASGGFAYLRTTAPFPTLGPGIAAPQIELFQDGVSLATYTNASDAGVPPMTAIRLGLETHTANPSSYDVYLDDVAMDTRRVGCP
jgi:hypothetical protein